MNKSTGETLPSGTVYEEGRYNELAFGCVHVLSPAIFSYMGRGQWNGKFSIIPFYIDICRQARIQCYPIDTEGWFDVGKPETLAQAEDYYRKQR